MANITLNKIKELLGIKLEFEKHLLTDGMTTVEADSFEVGQDIFIVSEAERVSAPEGDYELDDGRTIVVDESGVITEVKDGTEEEEEEEEMNTETKPVKKVVESKVTSIHFSKKQYDSLIVRMEAAESKIATFNGEDCKCGQKKGKLEVSKEEMTKELKNNPEAEVQHKFKSFRPNKQASTLGRIYESINNIKK